MVKFLEIAQPQYDKLKEEHDSAKADCTKLSEYFNCKNDIKFEFFKDLYEFSIMFKQTGIRIQKQREKEAKELKNAQIKAARQERLKKKIQNQSKGNGAPSRNSKSGKSNGNGKVRKDNRRTSSNRASQLYSKNGLNKKRGSMKKGAESGETTMDSQYTNVSKTKKRCNKSSKNAILSRTKETIKT